MTSRLFAWAHALSPTEVVTAAARFPGLGVILRRGNYDAAWDLALRPIAYVASATDAEAVADLAAGGIRWHAAIIQDERNQTGPSGSFMPPEQYASLYRTLAQPLLDVGVPVSTMGLAPMRTPLWDILRSRRFDDQYHARLPDATLRAFNPNGVRQSELERAMAKAPRWILSPAPFRGWWDDLMSPIKVKGWARYASDPRVHAIALWVLREVKHGDRWQVEHGLLDRHDRMTRVGRAVERALREASG